MKMEDPSSATICHALTVARPTLTACTMTATLIASCAMLAQLEKIHHHRRPAPPLVKL